MVDKTLEVPAARPHSRGKWALWAVIAVCAAPMLVSYLTYYVIKPQSRSNYGTLIDPRLHPMPTLAGRTLEGGAAELEAWRGKWIMLQVDSGACGDYCRKKLWEMRQLRLVQGKEMHRIERVWLVPDQQAVDPGLLKEHEGLHVLRVDAAALRAWLPTDAQSVEEDHLYMIDPLGNLMMRFPKDADPNRIKRDVSRLLKASSIG